MFVLVNCLVKTSVRQAQCGVAIVSSKLLSLFFRTSSCCQLTTTLMTTGCSLHRGQCNPLASCWIVQLKFWVIIGRKKKHDSHLPLPLLGLSFNVVDGRAVCENTRERKQNLVQELFALKSSTPSEFNLSSIVGKLVFTGKGLCKRAGVHARRPLYQALKDCSTHRQAGVWPAHVLEAIAVCAETLFSAPPRTLHLDRWQWPSAVLYGDAALSTRRMAAILYIPGTCVQRAFSVQVPLTFLESLSPLGQRTWQSMALRRTGSIELVSIGSQFSGPSWS